MAKIAILGTGAWGTALANVLMENGHFVSLWGIDSKEINDLKKQKNTRYYGKQKLVRIPNKISTKITDILQNKPNFFIIAVPSVYIKSTISGLLKSLDYSAYFINVSKGLDPETNNIWSKSIKQMIGNKCKGLVTLIGPSFAIEVFRKEPTIVNVISHSIPLGRMVALLFNNSYFKCIEIKDEVGAEIIGALKNVMAIGMGIAYQLHASINTRAAMLAQVTKEINKIMKTFGGESDTITQFCGIGDIYLTCTDIKSRNFSFGKLVAEVGVNQALKLNHKTIEGYLATKIIAKIIKIKKIHAPILNETYRVLFDHEQPKNFVKNIMKIIID